MISFFRGPITGPKFFAIISLFFAVIIAVNIVLAVQAVRTFPGLEVKNAYVASQGWDADRKAQLALGWQVSARVHEGMLRLEFLDASGAPVQPARIEGIFGRATSTRDDQTPAFVFGGQAYVAPVVTSAGNWNLRVIAVAADGTLFRQRLVVIVD